MQRQLEILGEKLLQKVGRRRFFLMFEKDAEIAKLSKVHYPAAALSNQLRPTTSNGVDHSLCSKKIFDLEQEVESLLRSLNLDSAISIKKLKLKVSQLERKVKVHEESSHTADTASPSTHNHRQETIFALENDKLELQNQLLHSNFDREENNVRVGMMMRRVSELDQEKKQLLENQSVEGQKHLTQPIRKSVSSIPLVKKHAISSSQLEINRLSELVAQLQRAAKTSISSIKFMEVLQRNKQLKASLHESQSELDCAKNQTEELTRVQTANQIKTSKQNLLPLPHQPTGAGVKRPPATKPSKAAECVSSAATVSLKDAFTQFSAVDVPRAKIEISDQSILSDSESSEVWESQKESHKEIQNLLTAEERTSMETLMRQLQQELDTVRASNRELQEELDAFDPTFFEELEDLKFNYSEALRMNQIYQQQQPLTSLHPQ